MSVVNNTDEIFHRIRVKLHHNYLPSLEGSYVARTKNEAALSIENVCASMKNRGGYTGSYENLVENIKLYYREMAYQLCDGFSINTGLYSIQPNIGGVFYSANDAYDGKKNPVNFRFRLCD